MSGQTEKRILKDDTELGLITDVLGKPTDAEALTDGSHTSILKRIRTLIGNGIVTLGQAVGTTGLLMAGSDGANARAIKTDTDGTLYVDGTVTAAQSTHDNLNVNANMQVGNADVATANPVPTVLTGSNVEQTIGQAIPSKAVLQGVSDGVNIQARRGATFYKQIAVGPITSGGTATIWTPTTGKKIRLMGFLFAASAAGQHYLRSGVAGSGIQIAPLSVANIQMVYVNLGQGRLGINANDVLEVLNNTAQNSNYYIVAWGTEE